MARLKWPEEPPSAQIHYQSSDNLLLPSPHPLPPHKNQLPIPEKLCHQRHPAPWEPYNKQTLYNNVDVAINYAELVRDLDISLVEKPIMNIIEEFDSDKLLELEYSSLGVYITSHPASKYQKNIATKDIKNYFDKTVEIPLYIERVNEIFTKKNETMAFATASDLFGKINLTIFPNVLKNIKFDLRRNVYLIKGKVEKRFSEFQIIVSEIAKLD